MKKDAYWFSHDSNAKDDPKSMKLIDQLGLEGYGIYWVLIETLRDQPEFKYPLDMLPILARRYNTSGEKMKAVVSAYGLFNVDEEDNFFSLSLNQRMVKITLFREQRRIAGLKSAEKRTKSIDQKATPVQHPFNDRSSDVQLKENRIEENRIKENKRIEKSTVKDKTKFIPPSLSEVILFFKEKGYSEQAARKAFNHYDLANWHDTNGHPVISWKQKMNTNWFKPENLIKEDSALIPPPIPKSHV